MREASQAKILVRELGIYMAFASLLHFGLPFASVHLLEVLSPSLQAWLMPIRASEAYAMLRSVSATPCVHTHRKARDSYQHSRRTTLRPCSPS